MQVYHFLISSLITFLLLKIFIPILKEYFPDNPNRRGMHKKVKPTSGGIFFVFTYILMAIYQGFYLPILSAPLSIIGILDDKYNISRFLRLFAQVLTTILVLLFFGKNTINLFTEIIGSKSITILLFLIIGVSIINFINFMDGIDGLICGTMIIVFLVINDEFHYLSPFIGALTAFLIYNWEPSKLFMGDSGSMFIGSYLASLNFTVSNEVDFYKNIILCSPLYMDCIVTIIRRIINKQNIFTPHKLHLYQRLVSSGMSHSKVSLIYIFSILILGLVYTFYNLQLLILSSFLIFFFGIFIDKKYAVKFK